MFVDWLQAAGQKIDRIDDYTEWLARFETALTGLPEKHRQQSVLPLLQAYQEPERPLRRAGVTLPGRAANRLAVLLRREWRLG